MTPGKAETYGVYPPVSTGARDQAEKFLALALSWGSDAWAGLIRRSDAVERLNGHGRRKGEEGDGDSTRYVRDANDRLVAIQRKQAGAIVTTNIEYDALDRPVSVNGRSLGWDGAGPLSLLPARIGDAETVQLHGVPLAEVDPDGEVRWLSADWRGSVGPRQVWGENPDPSRTERTGHPEFGFLGELEVDGLVWLRARWYDPATHTFLTRDPQAGELVTAGAGTNPYLYANNDPIQWVDPTGLHPVTAADASKQMQDWKQGHLKQVVTVAAVCICVGVAIVQPELIPAMLIGAGISGGANVGSSLISHKPIDPWDVAMNTALGGLAGAGGEALMGSKGLLASKGILQSTAGKISSAAAYGGVSNTASSALTEAADHNFSLANVAVSGGIGTLTGGAAKGLFPGGRSTDQVWQDFTKMNPDQIARAQQGVLGPIRYAPRVAFARARASFSNTTHQIHNRFDTGAGPLFKFGSSVGNSQLGSVVAPSAPQPSIPPSQTHYPPVPAPATP